MKAKVTCPGCGLILPGKGVDQSTRFNASGECIDLFHELSGYTLSFDNLFFIHQLAVDAYGAQHSGGVTKNITTAFSLIGLCLAVEHHYTGRQIQMVHMKIPKQNWPTLEPPQEPGPINVKDVLNAATGSEKEKLIREWSTSVWESWQKAHDWIREKTNEFI